MKDQTIIKPSNNQHCENRIVTVSLSEQRIHNDLIALEEPMQIRLQWTEQLQLKSRVVNITMRTPGDDLDLICGWMFSEGIIRSNAEIQSIEQEHIDKVISNNQYTVTLSPEVTVPLSAIQFRTTSHASCGICGKTSLQSIELKNPPELMWEHEAFSSSKIFALQEKIRRFQTTFFKTGGVHSSALFDHHGEVIDCKEDIGRHNALDKLIGSRLKKNKLPLKNHLLFASGRVSYEIVQKAIMSGAPILVAKGAPSSLAIQTAKRFNLTLIGFLNNNRYNIYHGESRIDQESQ